MLNISKYMVYDFVLIRDKSINIHIQIQILVLKPTIDVLYCSVLLV